MSKKPGIPTFAYPALLAFCLLVSPFIKAQVVDSIAFHLYTDSLKKGVQNYINVDGLLKEGRWVPLSGKDLTMVSSYGKFEGNNLVIDPGFTGEKVFITATYIRNQKLSISTTIYMKTVEENGHLKTLDEVMQPDSADKKTRKKKKGNP